MAHELFRHLDPTEIASFAKAGKWDSTEFLGKPYYIPGRSKNQFVRPNGLSGIHEDFADDIECYTFSPERLKQITPEVFQWIQKRYGDKIRSKARGNK